MDYGPTNKESKKRYREKTGNHVHELRWLCIILSSWPSLKKWAQVKYADTGGGRHHKSDESAGYGGEVDLRQSIWLQAYIHVDEYEHVCVHSGSLCLVCGGCLVVHHCSTEFHDLSTQP